MALTERYVSVAGGGAHDGTSEANAFTWAEMITDLNTPRVGYRYNVKAGTYTLSASTTLTGDGTTTSPNVIRGYNSTIGDLDAIPRLAGGALDTTNFPVISYGSTTYGFGASTADYLAIYNLKFTGSGPNGVFIFLSYTESLAERCAIESSSTWAGSSGLFATTIVNCDVLKSGATGGTAAIDGASVGNAIAINGCRIKCVSAHGVLTIAGPIKGCTIYECGAHGVVNGGTNRSLNLIDNTIVNCGGSGAFVVAGTTVRQNFVGNHITGCGGYAFNFNGSVCVKILTNNRTRGNALGAFSASDDWILGTNVAPVTTDDGSGDAQDYVDASTDDYSLVNTVAHVAPALNKGTGYLLHIGGVGTALSVVVMASMAFARAGLKRLIGGGY